MLCVVLLLGLLCVVCCTPSWPSLCCVLYSFLAFFVLCVVLLLGLLCVVCCTPSWPSLCCVLYSFLAFFVLCVVLLLGLFCFGQDFFGRFPLVTRCGRFGVGHRYCEKRRLSFIRGETGSEVRPSVYLTKAEVIRKWTDTLRKR